MKRLLLAICLLLAACSHEEEKHQPKIISRKELDPQPAPTPVPTNPFEKPAPVPPPPVVFQNPTFQQVGGELKMNEDWSVWIWRDVPNNTTCYFYSVKDNRTGISCVKN